MKRQPILDISVTHSFWRRIPHLRARLEQVAGATLAHLPERFRIPCTMTLLLTSNATIRRLNRDFRGVDRPTNVLSFPQFQPQKLPKKGKRNQVVHIGDIAISYQYIVAEAKKDHKILINHATHLLIHGILHLFGYDHRADAGAARMERLEKRIMVSLGLPDPYRTADETPGKK